MNHRVRNAFVSVQLMAALGGARYLADVKCLLRGSRWAKNEGGHGDKLSQTLFEDTSGHAFDNTDVEVTLINEVNAESHTSEAAGLSDGFTANIYVYLRKAGRRYRSSFEEVIRRDDECIALMDAVGKNILGPAFGNGLSRLSYPICTQQTAYT